MEPVEIKPEIVFIATVVVGLVVGRVIKWIKDVTPAPDPWSDEVDQMVHEADAVPVCHKCLTPYSENDWFCEQCGSAIGSYNTLNPYLSIFSIGEMLRSGTSEKIKLNLLTVIGYLLAAVWQYAIFAPIYWVMFFLNVWRRSNLPSSND
jgi:hypothetical protein